MRVPKAELDERQRAMRAGPPMPANAPRAPPNHPPTPCPFNHPAPVCDSPPSLVSAAKYPRID
eukprot:6176458-Pleurochrysis_carterae.AAC.1